MSRFAKYAWFVVGYTIVVILWGAVVRITGSGAGCGSHWPDCNGQIIPRPEEIETLIEFSHRVSSAFSGVLVIVLVIWAFRAFPRKSPVRGWSLAGLFFILVEGWIGMALVRLELVADNASVDRAVWVAGHLGNTFILLATLVVTAWLGARKAQVRWRGDKTLTWLMGIALIAVILFSSAGAVTALGDTLFPAESLMEGIRQDLDPASNFLIQLRIIHPALAITTSLGLYWLGQYLLRRELGDRVKRMVTLLYWVMGTQILAGFVTVILLAPPYMQVVHLLLADLFWLSLIVLAANVLTVEDKA
ncbi:MAG: heme A synthase [Chloroflexi bacterium]|nr:MAG: heme A synthase [Chloroflexota bacterium]MBL1196424.1 heme A synthase [Chloroflexota bacterium]NOH13719.1 heme A synthase [Chloroflexota bacterium]